MKRHTKLHVWKGGWHWHGKMRTTPIYCKKHTGDSPFGEEREHGGNEACRSREFREPLWYRKEEHVGLLTDARSTSPRCCARSP